MYILKIEKGYGYEYKTIPQDFNIENKLGDDCNLKEFKINFVEYSHNCIDTMFCVIEKNINDNKQKSKEPFYGAERIGKKYAGDNGGWHKLTFETPYKHISYYDKEFNELRHIFFNGKAYLIKESGKTIEKF